MDGNNKIEERLLTSTEGGDCGGGGGGDLKKGVWVESRKIWRVAFPGILARVSSFGTLVITQSFMGHISELDLAAYALVQTLIVRFSNGILLGMSSATETLCGQAFGAGQHHMMGIYLQRSWIVNFITATILLPFFIFTTPIFRLLGEEEAIAKTSKNIALWFIAFLYSFVFALTIQMYLQAQLKNMVVAVLCTSSFAIHVLLSWIFVSILDLGIPGAMGALAISSWLVVFGEFVYLFGGWCPHSWKGFTTAAFSDLWPVVKLSVSSGIMLCLELWYNSVLILVAGYMSNAEVAISAFSICLNISAWEFMLCLGFLGAACVRVANELGRGDAKAAKFSIKVILWVAVGAGLQSIVAGINLCCFYVIGIPIGVLLAYVADLEVKGLWIGMTAGVVMQVIALSFMVWRTDWDEQVNKASERLGRWFLKPSEESDEGLNHS
ncbi:hypothetical protein TEA_011033 [Camellia sinensis var. sinensis]|uniref:Protein DETOXIFICATION n=1 Tax=Camellia sinensis var. sinensis TaxID=542762 RepID=A0A4S4DMN8_CAMSN|nr:hypothetical protein TEA_011033 [Camellia sinensis var. sinensis]